jgi:hypothetical protein
MMFCEVIGVIVETFAPMNPFKIFERSNIDFLHMSNIGLYLNPIRKYLHLDTFGCDIWGT